MLVRIPVVTLVSMLVSGKSRVDLFTLQLAQVLPLKTLDTIGNCQRPVFSPGVSQHTHKITNLGKFELNRSSKLRDNNERGPTGLQTNTTYVIFLVGVAMAFNESIIAHPELVRLCKQYFGDSDDSPSLKMARVSLEFVFVLLIFANSSCKPGRLVLKVRLSIAKSSRVYRYSTTQLIVLPRLHTTKVVATFCLVN